MCKFPIVMVITMTIRVMVMMVVDEFVTMINHHHYHHCHFLKVFAFSLQRNTFQAVLISDGSLSFVIFLYNQLTWLSGDVSNGIAAQVCG